MSFEKLPVDNNLYVQKRNGKYQKVQFDKILYRLEALSVGLNVNVMEVAKFTIDDIVNGIATSKLDEIAARHAANMNLIHPDYLDLASGIMISNHHKNTLPSFSDTIWALYHNVDTSGKPCPLIDKVIYDTVQEHGAKLDEAVQDQRDYLISFFGFMTLYRAYLLRTMTEPKVYERPQHMWMRTAIEIHRENIEAAIETYNLLSQKYYTHATPTLFNAGTPRPQLSSCFLLGVDDSLESIYKVLTDCAMISKWAGGIGIHVHNIRPTGSTIRGTNGKSNGLLPMLRVFDTTADYVDQCFIPETLIYCVDGLKTISDIAVGDKVITKSGYPQEVQRVMHNQHNGKLYVIKTCYGYRETKVTGEHLFWGFKHRKGAGFNYLKETMEKKLHEPEWIAAKDLQEKDFIAIPIPKYEKDIDYYGKDDCRMYGILLGDGCLSGSACYVSMSKTKKSNKTAAFVRSYLSSKVIKFSETSHGPDCMRIQWQLNERFPFTKTMLYDSEKRKRVHPSMLYLPKGKTLRIIQGLIETDGTIKKEILLELTSFNVIDSVQFMLLRCGIASSGNSSILRIPLAKPICDLMGIASGNFFKYFTHNDHVFCRVKDVQIIDYSGPVIDLKVKENPSYLTQMGCVHNGGGKRKGSFAIYLEPWHADIEIFLHMKRNQGEDKQRARDLFYAMWIPDLFMERVRDDAIWSLFCPDKCPGLADVWGQDFVKLYQRYESENRYVRQVPARKIWEQICVSQEETGTPYMLYKDACNRLSNQQNLGTIRSSNLCTEIIQYSSTDEYAVCNLASIALPMFIKEDRFSFKKLYQVTRVVTRNLNKLIDRNYYPTVETKRSNMRHRPIGIGVQGLADVFQILRVPFDSQQAYDLNSKIFETIYFGALTESCDLAGKIGPYETFQGSPLSKGKFHFDLWNECCKDRPKQKPAQLSNLWNWEELRKKILRTGVRNSLCVAPMPTASTSQILGNNETIEPYNYNMYTRRVLAGDYWVINRHMIKDLIKEGLWSFELVEDLKVSDGSIQNMKHIPEELRNLYKTAYDLSQKTIIDLAAGRAPFVDQSQSLNLFLKEPSLAKLTSMHFYGWEAGLKTGMYYLRSQAASQNKATVNPSKLKHQEKQNEDKEEFCTMEEGCLSCGA